MIVKSEKVLILGKSGSGKDYLMRKLVERGLKGCLKWTTRPQRKHEQQGVTYNFVSDEQFTESINENKFLTYQTFNVTQKYNLIDLSIEKNIKIKLPSISNINSINIKLGIDSLESYSPNFDGDLDPIHGMYWTWQSGFINFKIVLNVLQH